MLQLTRKIGETIVINNDIYLTVCGFEDNKVRLVFDAPGAIVINREEIHERIQSERRLLNKRHHRRVTQKKWAH